MASKNKSFLKKTLFGYELTVYQYYRNKWFEIVLCTCPELCSGYIIYRRHFGTIEVKSCIVETYSAALSCFSKAFCALASGLSLKIIEPGCLRWYASFDEFAKLLKISQLC